MVHSGGNAFEGIMAAVPSTQHAEAARLAQRQRVLKSCVIAYSGRHVTQVAAVRDISEHGARLRVETQSTVPDTFELILDLDGIEADCEVVWRRPKEIGVRFTATRVVAPKRTQVVHATRPADAISIRRAKR